MLSCRTVRAASKNWLNFICTITKMICIFCSFEFEMVNVLNIWGGPGYLKLEEDFCRFRNNWHCIITKNFYHFSWFDSTCVIKNFCWNLNLSFLLGYGQIIQIRVWPIKQVLVTFSEVISLVGLYWVQCISCSTDVRIVQLLLILRTF